MAKDDETPDYEIGYGKPPKSGQFQKGASGNPSGRPKKPTDLHSTLLREGNSEVPINENGRPKRVKKIDLVVKQVWHKAAAGNIQAQRLLFKLLELAEGKAAETKQSSGTKPGIGSFNADDLTDDELAWIVNKGREELAKDDKDDDED